MRGFLAVVVSAALFFPSFAQCPSYTKGRDSLAAFPLGSPSALPEGFVLYRVRQSRGLFRTSTRQYSPSIVSGTQSDDPYSISISPDGAWVLYLDATTGAIVVQRLDGSGRAELYLWGTRVTGFYRQSPYGTEAFYVPDRTTMRAVPLDLSGSPARFLDASTRTILDLGYTGRSLDNQQYTHSGYAVCRDQILCREDGFDPYVSYSGRTGFYTIPDSGRGTAGPENLHPWLDDPLTSMWGCGHTMSYDGMLCAANTSLIGTACDSSAVGPSCLHDDMSVSGSACIPNRRAVALHINGSYVDTQHYDHKGFSVFRFWRDTDPAIPIHDIVDRYGVSINWAPPAYRRGEYDQVDFASWDFSNDPRYLVGVLKGSRIDDFGFPCALWVVDWVSNTWTRLTPDTLTLGVDAPAMYFTDTSAVARSSAPAAPRRAVGACLLPLPGRHGLATYDGVPLYALDGRSVALTPDAKAAARGVVVAGPRPRR